MKTYKCINCDFLFDEPKVEYDSITFDHETKHFETEGCPECSCDFTYNDEEGGE